MYHLMNDIYVESDIFGRNNVHRVNISKSLGFEYIPDAFEPEVYTQYSYAESLDDYCAEDLEILFKRLVSEEKKIFIFADTDTYIRLWAATVKAHLPNVDLETFKYLFLCKKIAVDCKNMYLYRQVLATEKPVAVLYQDVVDAFHREDLHLVELFKELLSRHNTRRSFEWDLLKARYTESTLDLVPRLKVIINRVIMTVVHESLGHLAGAAAENQHWDYLGCDMDSMLMEKSIFNSFNNLTYLSNSDFVLSSALKTMYPDDFLIPMMEELLDLLKINNDFSVYKYVESVLGVYKRGFEDITTIEELMDVLHQFFDHSEAMVRISHMDLGKFDDNMIRWAINLDVETMTRCLEGVPWTD